MNDGSTTVPYTTLPLLTSFSTLSIKHNFGSHPLSANLATILRVSIIGNFVSFTRCKWFSDFINFSKPGGAAWPNGNVTKWSSHSLSDPEVQGRNPSGSHFFFRGKSRKSEGMDAQKLSSLAKNWFLVGG